MTIESAAVRARAPLRLGLAGGGTDVSPYCDVYGGYVLNATISRYAYAMIRMMPESSVRFVARDQLIEETLPLERRHELNGRLNLHKAVYNAIVSEYCEGKPIPIELSTFCEAPPGSGLGSSSTLVVAMIKAFAELLNLALDDYAIAHLAYRIERVDCGLQGGRQDQYAATFGGFNFMEFRANNAVLVNPLRIKSSIICELEASLLLFFSGRSRDSAKIIAEQASNVRSNVDHALEAMHALKHEAVAMKEGLLKGKFNEVVESMRAGWEYKKRTASQVSNPRLEQIYNAALQAGALAGRISGAGGGGFLLFFVPPDRRVNVERVLAQFDGQVSNCHFTRDGARAWRV